MKVMATVTLNFTDEVAECKSFFNFSLLYPVYHQEVFPYDIPANGMVVKENHFAADGKFELEVTNNVNLRTFLSSSPTLPQGQMQETVGAGKFTLNIAAYNVDTKTNVYLLIFNLSTSEEAVIKLRI